MRKSYFVSAASVSASLGILAFSAIRVSGAGDKAAQRYDEPAVISQDSYQNPADLSGGHLTAITSVSWATTYETVAEMAASSDLVVHATVIENEGVFIQGSIADGTFRSVSTLFRVRVTAVGVGDIQPGQELVIVQSGGQAEGVDNIVEGDPMLAVGQEFVFFLTKHASNEYFWILGGALGRLLVSGDNASSLSQVDESAHDNPDLGIKDQPVAAVLDEARRR